MATPQDGDTFLVNRNGISYYVLQENLMASVQDDDLLLINRDGSSYKITGAELKGSFETFTVDTPTMLLPENGATGVDPNLVTLVCSPYAANPNSQIVPFGHSTWQIATTQDFTPAESIIINAVNEQQETFTVSSVPFETANVATATEASSGTDPKPVNLTFDSSVNLDKFAIGDPVSCITTDTTDSMPSLRFWSGNGANDATGLWTQVPEPLRSDSSWTFSTWIKPTNNVLASGVVGYESMIIKFGSDQAARIFLYDNQDGTFLLKYWNGSEAYSLALNITVGAWEHIVVAFDGPNGKMYSWRGGNNIGADGLDVTNNSFSDGANIIIGGYDNQTYYPPKANVFPGYLSQTCLVVNQVLTPSTFAYTDDNNRWAPKSATDLKASVNYVFQEQAPAVFRPNMSRNWLAETSPAATGSSTCPTPETQTWLNLYDGDLSTGANCTSNTGCYSAMNFSPEIAFTDKLRVYIASGYTATSRVATITYDSDAATEVDVPMVIGWNTISSGQGAGKLLTLEATAQSGTGSFVINAIEVDGRILMNGPCDNSRQWSDYWQGPIFNSSAANSSRGGAFSWNNENTGAKTLTAEDGGTLEWIPQGLFPAKAGGGTYTVYLRIYQDNNTVTVNGQAVSLTTVGDDSGQGEATITVNSLDSVKIVATVTSARAGLCWITVDGAQLINSGYSYNTSHNWSDGVIVNGNNYQTPLANDDWNPMLCFDGDIVTTAFGPYGDQSSGVDSTMTINFPETFTGTRLVSIYTNIQPNATIKFNGQLVYTNDTGTLNPVADPISIYATDLDQIIITSDAANSNTSYVYGIAIDGVLLVDGTPFGTSGFYLPYNTSNQDILHSKTISPISNMTGTENYPPILYDTTENNGLRLKGDGSSKTVLFAGDYPLEPNSVIEIFSNLSAAAGAFVNGILVSWETSNIGANGTAWNKIAPGQWADNNLQTLEMVDSADYTVCSIKIDGRILRDSPGFAQDDSGSGNHFYAINQQYNSDQTNPLTGAINVNQNLYQPQTIFNGCMGNLGGTWANNSYAYQATNSTNGMLTNLDIGDGTSEIVVYGYTTGASALVVNGTSIYDTFTGTTQPIAITEKKINTLKWTDDGGTLYISGITVGGKPVTSSSQNDVTLDNPITAYPVLRQTGNKGTNLADGDLFFTGDATQYNSYTRSSMPKGSKYYMEVTVDSRTDGGTFVGGGFISEPIDPTESTAYSKGVCPILYSNALSLIVGDPSNGDLGSTYGGGAQLDTPLNQPYQIGDVMGVLLDSNTGIATISTNGVTIYRGIPNCNSAGNATTLDWSNVYGLSRNNSGLQGFYNFGQQEFVIAKNNLDGTGQTIPTYLNDEIYSASLSASEGGFTQPATNAFDGQTYANTGQGSSLTVASTGVNSQLVFTNDFGFNGVVRIWTWTNGAYSSNQQATQIKVDEGEWITAAAQEYNYGWFSLGDIGEFEKISVRGINAGAPYIGGIEINGRVLVDSDMWTSLQNYSDGLTSQDGSVGSNMTMLNAFDAHVANPYRYGTNTVGVTGAITWVDPGNGATETAIEVKDKIEFLTGKGNKITLNYNAIDVGTQNDGDPAWITYTNPSTPLIVTQFQILGTETGSRADLFAIKVDGKILVNKCLTTSETFRTMTAEVSADAVGGITLTGTVSGLSSGATQLQVQPTSEEDDWLLSPGSPISSPGRTGLERNTTYYARVKHSSNNGIDSDFSAPTQFETEADAPEPPPPSEVNLGGLRCGGPDRNSTLSRYLATPVISNWVISFWAKGLWSTSTVTFLAGWDDNNSNSSGCYIVDGVFYITHVGGFCVEGDLPNDWDWGHIMLRCDGQVTRLYVNGKSVGTGAAIQLNGNIGSGSTYPLVIGSQVSSQLGANAPADVGPWNGYLSEFYFIDNFNGVSSGETSKIDNIEVDMFGRLEDGIWRPRNPESIAASLRLNGTYCPRYEKRPNYRGDLDALGEWSKESNFDLAYNIDSVANIFNGEAGNADSTASYGSFAIYGGGNKAKWTNPVSMTGIKQLRIFIYLSGPYNSISTVPFLVNGNNYNDLLYSNTPDTNPGKWIAIPETSLETIEWGYNSSLNSGIALCAIEVDGRVLINGNKNNDFNFSGYGSFIQNMTREGWYRIFDGKVGTTADQASYSTDDAAGVPTVDIGQANAIPGTVRIYQTGTGGTGTQAFIVNGSTVTMPNNHTTSGWQTVPNVTEFYSFGLRNNSTNWAEISAIEVGGKILTDAGYEFSQEQIWSNGGNVYYVSPYNVQNGFDGNIYTLEENIPASDVTQAIPSGDNPTYSNNFPGGDQDLFNIAASHQVRFHGWTTSGVNVTIKFKTSQGDFTCGPFTSAGNPSGDGSKYEVFDCSSQITFPCTITGIDWAPANNSNNLAFAGLEIDGKLLVDNYPFGFNGMYFPFSAANPSENYSAYTTCNFNSGHIDDIYNASLLANGMGSDSSGQTFVLTKPLGVLNSVGFWSGGGGYEGGQMRISVNDGSIVSGTVNILTTGSNLYTFILPEPTEVTKITIEVIVGGGFIYGIEADNIRLVDYASVGYDASGSNNNATDLNLAVGTTEYSYSVIDVGGTSVGDWAVSNAANFAKSFNGFVTDPNNANYTISASDSAGFHCDYTFETPVPLGSVFQAFGAAANGGSKQTNAVVIYTDANPTSGDDIAPHLPQGTQDDMAWTVNLFSPGPHVQGEGYIPPEATVMTGIRWWNDGANSKGYTGAFMVDGKLLIDANDQDSVLDTPFTDYSVTRQTPKSAYATLTYGNLEIGSDNGWGSNYSTLPMDGGKYYFEATMDYATQYMYIGVCKQDSMDGGTYPGQTASSWGLLQNNVGNTTQVLYDYTTFGTYVDVTPQAGPGMTIGVALDLDAGTVDWIINGEKVKRADNGTPATFDNIPLLTPMVFAYDSYEGSISVNFGQMPFAYGNSSTLDQGKVTVAGQEYQTLFIPHAEALSNVGELFYVPVLGKAVRGTDLKRRFGLPAEANTSKGIFALTQQPIGRPIGYSLQGHLNQYAPIEDHSGELEGLKTMLANAAKPWAQGTAYASGQIVSYNSKYYLILKDYTVGAAQAFNDADEYLTPVHS